MYQYTIKENGFSIGSAIGKHRAFEFIQKEVDRKGLQGYWKDDNYLIEGKPVYTLERGLE